VELVLLAGVAFGVYALSILLHPYMACEACDGQGKHRGAVFSYAFRPCERCSGTGRKQRLGARLLNRGERRKQGKLMP
jgi:DnaJ-class molecular chaperone